MKWLSLKVKFRNKNHLLKKRKKKPKKMKRSSRIQNNLNRNLKNHNKLRMTRTRKVIYDIYVSYLFN